MAAFHIETGQVANQSFAGGPYNNSRSNYDDYFLYMGAGDYTTLNECSGTQLDVNSTFYAPWGYLGKDFSFGQMNFADGVPTTGYFTSMLQKADVAANALFSYSFQGLGLPSSVFNNVASALANTTELSGTNELTCTAEKGGICVLSKPCDSYSDLWNLQFMFTFNGQSNYITVPLGAIAVNSKVGQECYLYLQYYDEITSTLEPELILGAMVMQLYKTTLQFVSPIDSIVAGTVNAKLCLSNLTDLTGSYIGAASYSVGPNPFSFNNPNP